MDSATKDRTRICHLCLTQMVWGQVLYKWLLGWGHHLSVCFEVEWCYIRCKLCFRVH